MLFRAGRPHDLFDGEGHGGGLGGGPPPESTGDREYGRLHYVILGPAARNILLGSLAFRV